MHNILFNEDSKINILFAPNGKGKTTILKKIWEVNKFPHISVNNNFKKKYNDNKFREEVFNELLNKLQNINVITWKLINKNMPQTIKNNLKQIYNINNVIKNNDFNIDEFKNIVEFIFSKKIFDINKTAFTTFNSNVDLSNMVKTNARDFLILIKKHRDILRTFLHSPKCSIEKSFQETLKYFITVFDTLNSDKKYIKLIQIKFCINYVSNSKVFNDIKRATKAFEKLCNDNIFASEIAKIKILIQTEEIYKNLGNVTIETLKEEIKGYTMNDRLQKELLKRLIKNEYNYNDFSNGELNQLKITEFIILFKFNKNESVTFIIDDMFTVEDDSLWYTYIKSIVKIVKNSKKNIIISTHNYHFLYNLCTKILRKCELDLINMFTILNDELFIEVDECSGDLEKINTLTEELNDTCEIVVNSDIWNEDIFNQEMCIHEEIYNEEMMKQHGKYDCLWHENYSDDIEIHNGLAVEIPVEKNSLFMGLDMKGKDYDVFNVANRENNTKIVKINSSKIFKSDYINLIYRIVKSLQLFLRVKLITKYFYDALMSKISRWLVEALMNINFNMLTLNNKNINMDVLKNIYKLFSKKKGNIFPLPYDSLKLMSSIWKLLGIDYFPCINNEEFDASKVTECRVKWCNNILKLYDAEKLINELNYVKAFEHGYISMNFVYDIVIGEIIVESILSNKISEWY